MGLAVFVLLVVASYAVKLRWELRRHFWFWVTVLALLALHLPLIPFSRTPQFKATPAIFVFPLGAVDFAIFLLTIGFVEDLFSSKSSIDE
jgi:hypothetical protein